LCIVPSLFAGPDVCSILRLGPTTSKSFFRQLFRQFLRQHLRFSDRGGFSATCYVVEFKNADASLAQSQRAEEEALFVGRMKFVDRLEGTVVI